MFSWNKCQEKPGSKRGTMRGGSRKGLGRESKHILKLGRAVGEKRFKWGGKDVGKARVESTKTKNLQKEMDVCYL